MAISGVTVVMVTLGDALATSVVVMVALGDALATSVVVMVALGDVTLREASVVAGQSVLVGRKVIGITAVESILFNF